MKSINIVFIILAIVIAFAGCSKDDDNNKSGTVPGSVAGKVKLTDEFGVDLIDYSGLKVSTQTGEFGITNASGSFIILNLKSGTYSLSYEKTGYGTFKRFNIGVAGTSSVTTLNGTDIMGQKSTTVIGNLSASWQSNDQTFTFGCDISPVPDASHPRAFRLFFSKTSDVSHENYLYTPANSWTSTTGTGVITGFSPQTLTSGGFAQGDSVYMIAVGESIKTNSYTNPVTGKRVFPNLNITAASNVVGFQLP